MDLLSLVLHLTPLPQPDDAHAPAWWGRATQALLLETVRTADPQLAKELHADSGFRPYTASSLIGPSTRHGLQPDTTYRLRLTGLRADLSALLSSAASDGPLAPGEKIELDYLPFRVAAVDSGNVRQNTAHSWSASQTFQELGRPHLLAGQSPHRRATLRFASPTTFKSGGKHVPIPLPELVFGSLLQRWNACAPLLFPEDLLRYARECLVISRYNLSSRMVALKEGGRRVGAVGRVTYATINYDRYWMSLVQTLAHFALFSGVGAGTTMGLGRARMLAERGDRAKPDRSDPPV